MESRSDSIREASSISSAPVLRGNATNQNLKRNSGGSVELSGSQADEKHSPSRVPRKFITNWRQACDRTKDRTKELLKRWRTIPGQEDGFNEPPAKEIDHPGWSVHVWTTWVSRFPSDESLATNEMPTKDVGAIQRLAPVQRDKLAHFFTYLLDHRRTGSVSKRDFELLSERLRRFADWSKNSPEYLRLMEIEQGLIESIISRDLAASEDDKQVDLEDWLNWWAQKVAPPGGRSFSDLPLWVKALPRVFFLAINTSATGRITKDEIAAFYSFVVGFDSDRIKSCIDVAYSSMTSNGDHPLGWTQYQLVFANFLFGRGPFGPGEHLLGMTESCVLRAESISFPIDYSAMNTPVDKMEVYSPHCKTNRRSVIV
ncbi:uncharacterized protein [Neodiprion pinetum]|uniref:uncharacterized protein LOC124188155 n=1 Tax=Neodiprion fabricii TaxID=2872261 RepID=UPI001ED8DF4E|nr:uncharacterized protein LOC124188155 [Neodiprion fabricii]XP_046487492.1 uncharacterized protein LOC124221467 [Neodiprion pinetum]